MDFAQYKQYLPTSLQGLLPDGTGSDPNQLPQDDTMMQLELKRKFALADALKNQAMPQGQMVGDRYVAPSWTQYLANAVGKYQGGQAENQAIKQYGDYTKNKNDKMTAALANYQKGLLPADETTITQQAVTKPLEIGANVPTSPYGTTDQVAQTAPNFNGTTPQSYTGDVTTQQPVTTTTQRPRTSAERYAAGLLFANQTDNPKLAQELIMGQAQNADNADIAAATRAYTEQQTQKQWGHEDVNKAKDREYNRITELIKNGQAISAQERQFKHSEDLQRQSQQFQAGQNTLQRASARVSAGYRPVPGSTTGQEEFIPGGPADPQLKANAPLGNRESVFINRIGTSANETAADLENIVKLPLTTNRGLFGGRQQGTSLFSAGKETLANAMTSQEVQSYNVLASGFQRNLASIEAAGLAPGGTLTHQMDAVIFKDGDTNYTKLQKLAQIKQIVNAGLETTLANPRIPKETRNHFEDVLKRVNTAVPFTNGDLLTLGQQQEINPDLTIQDILDAKKKTNPNVSTQQSSVRSQADAILGNP